LLRLLVQDLDHIDAVEPGFALALGFGEA
jgi:hypothetical protein